MPDRKSVAVFRIVVLSVVLSLGGLACFLLIFIGAPREPATGVSWEEHMRRIENGYYATEAGRHLVVILIYLAIVAVPHRWIVRSRVAYLSVITALSVPVLVLLKDFAVDVLEQRHAAAGLKELFHPINLAFDIFSILFCLMIPLSLFFSWKVRHTATQLSRP